MDISSINNERKTITSIKEIPNIEAPSRARQIIYTDDVLVSTVRPSLNAVAIVPENLNGEICSTGLCVLRPQQEVLDPKFLFAWVRHPSFVRTLVRLEQGIGYPAVRDRDITQTEIPLPPLLEQKRIVAILGEADELSQLRQQSNKKLKELFKSLFFRQFGTGVPTSKYPNTIKLRKLLEVSLASGFSPNTNAEPPGIPVFGLSAITDYGLDPKKIKYYPVESYQGKGDDLNMDDILITRSNTQELVGKVARYRGIPSPVIYPDLMIRIRLKEPEDSPYVENFLRSIYVADLIKRLARGTSGSMKKISQEDIYNFDVLYPPEQNRRTYAKQVREIERLWEQYLANADRLDDLFQSLLAQAFSGELTTAWREQHREELMAAAAERDRLLGVAQPAIEEQVIEGVDEVMGDRPPNDHPRYQLLRELSHEQYRLYQIITQQTGYFTAESLSSDEENHLSLTAARRGLQLLAESGLVVPISLPVVPTSGTAVYVPVHRQPKSTDEVRLTDLALLEGNTA